MNDPITPVTQTPQTFAKRKLYGEPKARRCAVYSMRSPHGKVLCQVGFDLRYGGLAMAVVKDDDPHITWDWRGMQQVKP